jgi:hypothetical protein
MNEEQKREFAKWWILDGIGDIQFTDIVDELDNEGIDDPDNLIAKDIINLFLSARITVMWDE